MNRFDDALDRESYVSLRSFKRSGKPVDTPVWFALSGGKLYVFTDGTSWKVKRIRRNPEVEVAVCGMTGTVTGPWLGGQARVVSDPAVEKAAYAALDAKYGWRKAIADLGSRLSGRITRRAMLEIERVDPDARSTRVFRP